MRRTVVPLLALLVLLGLSACGDDGTTEVGAGDDGDPAATDDPLADRDFVSEPSADLVAGTQLRLTFADGRLGLQAGCNQMTGAYTVEGDTLVVEPLAGTQMGCEPDLMDQDTRLAELFAEPVAWALDGDTLTLEASAATFTLVDQQVAEPPVALVGPTWALDTLLTGSGPDAAASSIPAGVAASITFGDDGTYRVEAGCNTGSGDYGQTGAATYTVDAPDLTRRRCDDGATEVELAVVAVLDGEVAVSIEGDRLTITADGGEGAGLGFTAG